MPARGPRRKRTAAAMSTRASTPTTFVCRTCGEVHDAAEAAFGPDAPWQWNAVSEEQRARSTLTADQCFLESDEGTSFYIRGCLDLPIVGSAKSFRWLVWCSLSERSADEISDHWDDPQREKIGPHFGWLCSELPFYPSTMFLKAHVVQRPPGVRPLVVLERTNHPLALEQRNGIDPERVRRIVADLLHP